MARHRKLVCKSLDNGGRQIDVIIIDDFVVFGQTDPMMTMDDNSVRSWWMAYTMAGQCRAVSAVGLGIMTMNTSEFFINLEIFNC